MPGSTPATSQLDWLSSTTAMIVRSWSKATRDLLKSFSWGIGALRQLFASDDGAISSPPAPYHLTAGGRRIRTLGPPSTVTSVQCKSAKKSPACRGAEEFICCQGEHGSKGRKRYLIGVSAPSASAGFGRVRPLEQLLPGTRPKRRAGSRRNGISYRLDTRSGWGPSSMLKHSPQ